MLSNLFLIIVSVVGFLISLYFTLVYYQRIPANYYLLPRFCRMEESTCQSILSTREARLFGAPNFLYGILYYALVFLDTLLESSDGGSLTVVPLTALSFSVVLLSIYLGYALLFKLKTACPLCFMSHGINGIISILLLLKLL